MADDATLSAIGRIDPSGLLIEADARLLDLVHRAGSDVGAPLAHAEMAGLVRLAQRLGIAIDRTITVADGDHDLELVVRAEPTPGGVTLHVGGWRPRAAWHAARSSSGHEHERTSDFDASDADWTWECDATLHLTHVTIGAGARFGFDEAAVLGQPIARLFALAEGEAGELPMLAAAAGRARFVGQPASIRGTACRVLLSAVPRLDEHGRFAGFVGATRLDADAVSPTQPNASTLPDDFANRLDQALRAPLKRIIANAASMNAGIDGPLAQSYADYAGDIATAGRHLLDLVSDLVDLDAIERDDFTTSAEPIDLADVARRAAGLLAVRAGERGVRIDGPAAEERIAARGDFRRALQVLVNLIANAVRFSPDGGAVWVRAERDGERACVIVADQGRGIAVADQAMIFEKFGRVDTGDPAGSGLGLYISRRLARAMGGELEVDSAPGQGARFIFTLPAS